MRASRLGAARGAAAALLALAPAAGAGAQPAAPATPATPPAARDAPAGHAAPVSASVAVRNGRPVLLVNGRPAYPLFYALTDVPGGRWSWEELPRRGIESFCAQGVRLVMLDLQPDHYWRETGVTADVARRQLRGAMEACPGAALFVRLNVGAPRWWVRRHPGEVTRYADAEPRPDYAWGVQRSIEDDVLAPARASLASAAWRADAGAAVRELLRQLAATPEGGWLAGVQVAGGVYGEWHYWGFLDHEPDVGAPMQAHFRAWLRARYGTDAALRRAWGRPEASLAAAEVPALAARRRPGAGMFWDPARQRDLIDYYEAQHEAVADDILHFARVVKEAWPRPIVTGAFYGYFYAVFGREAAGGHLQVQRVLRSPHLDYLAGPAAYYPSAVEVGDPYRSRGLLASVRLHGKLWLDEMDQQPPLARCRDSAYAASVRASVAQVRRNALFSLANGSGLWFYDFGPSGFNGGPRLRDHGAAGWWDDPHLMAEVGRLRRTLAGALDRPYETGADVLLVHDTDVFYHLGSTKRATALSHWANNWLPVGVFRSGAVFDPVHLADLDRLDLRPYRTVVFVNTFVLTPAQRRVIAERVARDGRHLVWVYAPGLGDGRRLDPALAAAATGIRLRPADAPGPTRLVADGVADTALTVSVWNDTIRPLLAADDRGAEVLGRYAGTAHAAVARKPLAASTAWFVGLPPADERFWRGLFRRTGAHVYTGPGAVVYAGAGAVVVHVRQGGRRTIRLRNGREVVLDPPGGATVLLDAQTGAVLAREAGGGADDPATESRFGSACAPMP